MRYRIVAIGKIGQPFLRDAIAEYTKRLRPYGGIECTEVPEEKSAARPSAAARNAQLESEGEALLRQLRPQDYVILLDLHGATCTSEEFAAELADLALAGHSTVTFVIGGAFGVGENLRRRAQRRLSLGPWTYTHQMVRYLLTEQLYRAEKIRRNEPYHW